MHPAGSDGEKVLSFGAVSARPRLPALTTLAPEPRHGGGRRAKASWISPENILKKCHPCELTTYPIKKFPGRGCEGEDPPAQETSEWKREGRMGECSSLVHWVSFFQSMSHFRSQEKHGRRIIRPEDKNGQGTQGTIEHRKPEFSQV